MRRPHEGMVDPGSEAAVRAEAKNTARAIAEELRNRILSGELGPNVRVTQRDLALHAGRSPMAARDAIKLLMAEGLIVQQGSKTIVVAPADLQDFQEIMELRILTEPLALELSIPRLGPEDLAEVRSWLALSGTTDCPREMVENHWGFHRALYRRAGRRRLLALIEHQHGLLMRYLLPQWAVLGVMRNWGEDECALMELVDQRRAEEAAEWLRCDLRTATDRVMQVPPNRALGMRARLALERAEQGA